MPRVDFARVAQAALRSADAVVRGLLPDGHAEGGEWVARNPSRAKRPAASFKVNLATGRWGEVSTGERGGDLVSLAACVCDLSQREAALRLA